MIGCAKIVWTRAVTGSRVPCGTVARRLRMKWNSCRYRHEVHYADQRIMPSATCGALWDKDVMLMRSAQS